MAYYGIIKYNYAKASSEKVQQLSYGGGIDLLLDFITTYSNKNNPTGIQTKRNFSSSFGIFGLGGFLKTHQCYRLSFD
ncbi:hypothetical protein N411_04745 [Helicobacter pylori FD535]|nr:hypothetical protein [Helicobacter pylori]EQL57361.1 hypothetical protein N411_04745 [Helicobacter pylori FD535]